MADDKKEPWLNLLALTTVILAVCATLATFKGGGYSTRSVLRQNQASDQWAYYQAKSIKGNLYEMDREHLVREVKLLEGGKGNSAALEDARKALEDTKAKVVKYDKEKAEIKEKAESIERERDDATKHGAPFGLAVIYLQIAILLSSIAALMKKQPVYWLGLVVGIVGLVYFANGFFLFFKV
ncbi:MAG: DUF4337 domain-containing protein [Geothrix sp.]|jgi:cell division protein FtsB|nr:DUF4337 domain-containing protein [Geothrix sp.]